MTPQYPYPPFAVNVCEICWGSVSWGDSDELRSLLSTERYAAEGNMIVVHRCKPTEGLRVDMECGAVHSLGTAYLSLIEIPASERIPGPAASLKDSLWALQEEIDDSVAVLARVIEVGLESIALAIRDQGPR